MWNALRSIIQGMENAVLTPEMRELNQKIEDARRAVEAAPNSPIQLTTLGNYLGHRYSTLGNKTDLDESIQFARKALNAASTEDRNRNGYLNNLAVGLGDRYSSNGSTTDLDEAIETAEAAISLTSANDKMWPTYANTLGNQLQRRYSQAGVEADLEMAIKFLRGAVQVAAVHQTPQETWADSLATALSIRSKRSGAQGDLDEAIQIARSVLRSTAADHPARARRLNNLANQLADRYTLTRGVLDLEEAIENARAATALIPDKHLDRAPSLSNLALLLGDMYTRTGSLDALNTAIKIGQESLESTPKNDPSRPGRLSNLSIQLRSRYGQSRRTDHFSKTALTDLNECIDHLREAVSLTGPNHPDRAQWLNNLGEPLGLKYEATKDMSVLQEAIKITREAVTALPETHADRAICLITLGDRIADRYSETNAIDDLPAIISAYQSALHHSNSAVLYRIIGGRKVLKYHTIERDWQTAYQDANAAVGLIQKLTGQPLDNSDKQYVLGQIVGLASDAAAAALNAGQRPSVALSLLEQGRNVLAAFLREMRTDISDLQARYPDLASEFRRLRSILDAPSAEVPSLDSEEGSSTSRDVATIRSRAGVDFSNLLAEIRQQSGFEDFLLPPREEEIRAAGKCGPIVVINVSELRCDAILVESDEIRCIALPHLQPIELEEMSQLSDRGSPEILERLWNVVAEPIFVALGYTEAVSGDSWPQIWWIPTGRLSKLPLHAAGRHSPHSTENVLDRAMSSYGSSIRAIIQGRRRRGLNLTSEKLAKALLVDMAVTPGQRGLKFAAEEVRVVSDLCKAASCEVVRSKRQKVDVLTHLPSCNMFHFAGHGSTDPVDPARSSLLLEDCEDNPLTVSDLMATNLQDHSPFLAYLSACGTGNVNDWKYLDESVHLISAYQLAGYRHVIGTMWDVQDESCLQVAKTVYTEILERGMTDESVCLGLHKATRWLREQWLQGLRKTVVGERPRVKTEPNVMQEATTGSRRKGDYDATRKATAVEEVENALSWVSYVHFGV